MTTLEDEYCRVCGELPEACECGSKEDYYDAMRDRQREEEYMDQWDEWEKRKEEPDEDK